MKDLITNEKLPEGIIEFIKLQKKSGGEVELFYNNIIDAIIKDGKITDCIYFEDDTKLQWFVKENILYIMINDKAYAYFEKGKLKIYK